MTEAIPSRAAASTQPLPRSAAAGAAAKPFRFFADQTYHFQTLRALSDIASGGADTSEVLETIKHIKVGDSDSWYAAWERTGDRVFALAAQTADRISRGRALLRAHNYYRTAEFLLAPTDPRRAISWKKNVRAFYDGLDTLQIEYERIRVPFGMHHLNALYLPGPQGSEQRPLIVICGGFDSTLEELYFVIVPAALERGYSVLAYEGPGQGSILREQKLPFTHEWEKPTAAVLDEYLRTHRRHPRTVLIGMSMGGYLAPRAAAFDERFDGVVAYDVFYDFGAISARSVPRFLFWLDRQGLRPLANLLVKAKAACSPYLRWAIHNSMWTMGTREPLETIRTFAAYTLDSVAQRIKADALILAGAEDHFVPSRQIKQFEDSLIRARSVTTVVYDRESGGAEHCQLGASTLWHATLFDWLAQKFPQGTQGAPRNDHGY
jgi:alpha-beta hydrolase superfamily lysophospholipase